MNEIKIKRVYETPDKNDGVRILVDRLWPRGLTKQKAKIDIWFKEIAPSDSLRKWFAHDPKRWQEFKKKYQRELLPKKDFLKEIQNKASRQKITLIYAARDTQYNNAVVLKEYLEKRF